MEKQCKYAVYVGQIGKVICLFYHDMLIRNDGLEWGHFPDCQCENCPIEHKELWESEAKLK